MEKVLFVGAHVDDEQCAAGTIAKFLECGHEMYLLALSFCEESTLQIGFSVETLAEEFESSTHTLGINNGNIFTYHFPVRNFPAYRQNILDTIIRVRNIVMPDLVIAPSLQDRHQDHYVVAEEVRRAFLHATILGFETPKQPLTTNHRCYVRLNFAHVNKKIECINCYESQKVRKGMDAELALSVARFRGVQAGCALAEAFEVVGLYL